MENITNPMSMDAGFGAPVWAPLGVSPIASAHGTGLPFAGYAATGTDARQLVKVPDPRGRQR